MDDIAPSRALRKKRQRPSSPVAAIGQSSHVDRVLAAFGVLIALSSLGFAGYMVSDVDRPPRIAGLEYLSIFARPSHFLTTASIKPIGQDTASRIAQSIDPTPTGSIPVRPGARSDAGLILAPTSGVDSRASFSPFKLLYVSNGEALLQTEVGILHVKAGDALPDLGRVDSIEKNGDHWVLTTQNGATLEWPMRPPIAADGAAPNGKPSLR